MPGAANAPTQKNGEVACNVTTHDSDSLPPDELVRVTVMKKLEGQFAASCAPVGHPLAPQQHVPSGLTVSTAPDADRLSVLVTGSNWRTGTYGISAYRTLIPTVIASNNTLAIDSVAFNASPTSVANSPGTIGESANVPAAGQVYFD